jgi:hypothetical protein
VEEMKKLSRTNYGELEQMLRLKNLSVLTLLFGVNEK